MRIALGLEYQGTSFYGWQIQQTVQTVQSVLEEALSKIADEPIVTLCAGRTDKGVHATYQVVHFDTTKTRPITAWIRGVNTYLPSTIVVRWAQSVDEQFHARFTAQSRRYQYLLENNHTRSAIFANHMGWHPQPLSVESMQEASQYLLGEQDFSAFRSAQCQSHTPMRHVLSCTVSQHHRIILFSIEANAFLHHMVRSIVGTLIKVGMGHQEPAWIKTVLQSKNRSLAGETASPEGLYLVNVRYPDAYPFPKAATLRVC